MIIFALKSKHTTEMKYYEIHHHNNTDRYIEKVEAENCKEARATAKRICARWNTKLDSVKVWQD